MQGTDLTNFISPEVEGSTFNEDSIFFLKEIFGFTIQIIFGKIRNAVQFVPCSQVLQNREPVSN